MITAGTFHHDGERVFWDVHDAAGAVVIELADECYVRLVIEVDDPRATVALIERAIIPASYRRLHAAGEHDQQTVQASDPEAKYCTARTARRP